MSTSTDAILAYGFDLGDADELPEAVIEAMGEEGPADWLDKLAGVEPWAPNGPADYWDVQKAKHALLPIDIITHCYIDAPMYFLAIRGTEQRAGRGDPKPVTTMVQAGWPLVLRAFCEQHGLEYKEPSWHIFSMWS